jgi:hypothetical protein
MRVIFVVTIVAFTLGIFFSGGYYFLGPKDYAVKINGTKISVRAFQSPYENLVKMYSRITNNQLSEQNLDVIKKVAMQALIEDEVFYQQSKIYGIVVTDEELRTDLQSMDAFKDNNVFSKVKFTAYLASMKTNPKEYELLRKKQIAGNKLKRMLVSSVIVWENELEEAVKQDSSVTRNSLRLTKANVIINEWYKSIINNSKIVRNDLIFK